MGWLNVAEWGIGATQRGFSPLEMAGNERRGFQTEPVPHYSTNAAAALEVVEHLRLRGIDTSLYANREGYQALISPHKTGFVEGPPSEPTAALAICRAALKAVAA